MHGIQTIDSATVRALKCRTTNRPPSCLTLLPPVADSVSLFSLSFISFSCVSASLSPSHFVLFVSMSTHLYRCLWSVLPFSLSLFGFVSLTGPLKYIQYMYTVHVLHSMATVCCVLRKYHNVREIHISKVISTFLQLTPVLNQPKTL